MPAASRFLWAFVALFIILGLGYSTLTPIFENSDETLHYPYIKHLADGQGLPLAKPSQLWNQEGTQHPLYYAIVAASTFWLDTDNLPEHLQRNPHWLFAEVRSLINDNQNLVLPSPMAAFPYRRAALAIHIGRWWSLGFGLLTVVCTFLITRHLFPDNLPVTVTATALTALTPQFLRVSATVSNDSLSAALTSLAVLAALKFTEPRFFWQEGSRVWRHAPTNENEEPARPRAATRAARGRASRLITILFTKAPKGFLSSSTAPLLLGLLCGLALLTKLSSLSTFFIVAAILFWRLFFLSELQQKPLQTFLQWLLIIAGVTLLLTGWWFGRNYQLYGEWLALDTHLNLAGRGNLSLREVWNLRAEVERAYWATFAWGQIRPPEWVYRLLFGFTRFGLVGLGLACTAKLIQGPKTYPFPLNLSDINFEKIVFLLLWASLNVGLYLRWVMSVGSVSHTRLMFPALTAISLLLALGWHALIPRRLVGWFSGLVIALLLALNLYSLGWLLYPAFSPTPPTAEVSPSATPLNLTFLDSLHLVEGAVQTAEATRPGDTILVRIKWQVLKPLDKNYSVAIAVLSQDGRVLAQRETYPGLGLRPTRYLKTGETFVDVYPLTLAAEVSDPQVARVTVSLFDLESETRAGFPARDPTGQEVTPVVGQVKIVPTTPPAYTPQQSTQVNFAETITLLGYDFKPEAEADGANQLILYWQAEGPVSADYSVFIHLLDAAGNIITQADAPPTNNAYPTSWWTPGEVIADTHLLPPAPGISAIRLGLYHLDSGQRLPITASALPQQDDAVEIALP